MDQKKNEQKTAQILYITIIMAMLIMALAVGLVTMANRKSTPLITTEASTVASTAEKTAPAVTTKITEATTKRPQMTTSASTGTAAPSPAINVDEPTPPIPEFIMPTIGNISKKFSIDTLVYSNTMEDYRTHNGIDICASFGDAVMAAAGGVVTEIYEDPMMGHTIVISHSGDMKTVYQNLHEEIAVDIGANVKSGEVIGAVGESAIIEIAEEPHLHFEMTLAGERVDPLNFISESAMTIVYDE